MKGAALSGYSRWLETQPSTFQPQTNIANHANHANHLAKRLVGPRWPKLATGLCQPYLSFCSLESCIFFCIAFACCIAERAIGRSGLKWRIFLHCAAQVIAGRRQRLQSCSQEVPDHLKHELPEPKLRLCGTAPYVFCLVAQSRCLMRWSCSWLARRLCRSLSAV
jgi:hypothetical protein